MIQTRPKNLTFEEYLDYDDGTDNRYELVAGELIEMPEASPEHSDIAEFLDRQFYQEVQRLSRDWKVKSGDVGIRTGVRISRTPDVCVIEGSVWRQLRATSASAVLQVPLLLVVEVVSPGEDNAERDYEDKKAEYEEVGIPEYWIVDPPQSKISVLLLVGRRYQPTEFRGSERIVSRTFPELSLRVEEVLTA